MITRQHLHQAWGEATRLYQLARVNSERTLQAILYSQLVAILPAETCVLCEPTIKIPELGIPDLVVVSNKEVTAVIEIKFVPHFLVPYEKDIAKLKKYGSMSTEANFPLILQPRTGKYSDEHFTFSGNCLLVFAVIARQDSKAVDEGILNEGMRPFADRFVPLVYPVSNQA